MATVPARAMTRLAPCSSVPSVVKSFSLLGGQIAKYWRVK
jgi:hypothetical protein